jgi:hypothetical protein
MSSDQFVAVVTGWAMGINFAIESELARRRLVGRIRWRHGVILLVLCQLALLLNTGVQWSGLRIIPLAIIFFLIVAP